MGAVVFILQFGGAGGGGMKAKEHEDSGWVEHIYYRIPFIKCSTKDCVIEVVFEVKGGTKSVYFPDKAGTDDLVMEAIDFTDKFIRIDKENYLKLERFLGMENVKWKIVN